MLGKIRHIIIVDPRAAEAWKRFQIDYINQPMPVPELIYSGMEDMALLETSFSQLNFGQAIAIFGSEHEMRNIRYATAFHKLFDKKDEIYYIIRANTKNSFPAQLLEKFLGSKFILIPTYNWLKAYFEDIHHDLILKNEGGSFRQKNNISLNDQ